MYLYAVSHCICKLRIKSGGGLLSRLIAYFLFDQYIVAFFYFKKKPIYCSYFLWSVQQYSGVSKLWVRGIHSTLTPQTTVIFFKLGQHIQTFLKLFFRFKSIKYLNAFPIVGVVFLCSLSVGTWINKIFSSF